MNDRKFSLKFDIFSAFLQSYSYNNNNEGGYFVQKEVEDTTTHTETNQLTRAQFMSDYVIIKYYTAVLIYTEYAMYYMKKQTKKQRNKQTNTIGI